MVVSLRGLASLLVVLVAAVGVRAQDPDDVVGEIDPFGQPKQIKRMQWFNEPRQLPNGTMPVNAWHKAWLKAKKMPVYKDPGPATPAGFQWEFMGPTQTDVNWLGRVNALAIDPTNSNIIYAGEAKGGLWKSTDGGATWTNLTDFLSSQVSGCITIDPVDHNTIYYGTGEEYNAVRTLGGVGIWKSTDAGATWTLRGNDLAGQRISDIAIDPTNRNWWAVGTSDGAYITFLGGTSWGRAMGGVCSSLKMDPSNHLIVWAALGDYRGAAANGIYKSTDRGVSYTLQTASGLPSGTGVGRIELSVCKSNPNVVYAVYSNPVGNKFGGIWKTTNGGTSWSSLAVPNEPYGQGWYDLAIAVDPNNPLVAYLGGVNLYKTTNGGASWTNITGDHTDHHQLVFDPNNSNTIFVGGDFGLNKITNGGATYTALNNGRGAMEYYNFDVHPTDPNQMFAGAQDNATQIKTGASTTFSAVIGGDGFWCAYDRTNPNVMIGEIYYGQAFRSTTGPGGNFSNVFSASAAGDRGYWSSPMKSDPTTSGVFYIGCSKLYKSTASGANGTWAAISPDLSGGGGNNYIVTFAIAPSTSQTIYTGANSGKLYVTSNGGGSWTDRSAGLTGWIGDIAIDPTNPNRAFVCIQTYGVPHVYATTTGGLVWTDISGNLPDVSCSAIAVNPKNLNQIFVGTDIGPFTTKDGVTWSRLGSNFPTVPITAFRTNATTGYLSCSTYGRGLWRYALPTGVTVSGKITLEGIEPTAAPRTITFDARDYVSNAVVATIPVSVAPNGNYTVTGLDNLKYTLSVHGKYYLRKNLVVDTSAGPLTGVNFTLKTGDVDGDNAITVFDYGVLSDYFDLTSGDGNWNTVGGNGFAPKDADFDGDDAITVFDYGYLSTNFDQAGDD